MTPIAKHKKLFFTVTNDLTTDQRMIRICSTLSNDGFDVTLVGRVLKDSAPLENENFKQKRLRCFFNSGKLFYAEYNIRLIIFLGFQKIDGLCAIDLDTLLPAVLISKLKSCPLIYDAHEYFPYVPEVIERPMIQKMWLAIERFSIPKTKLRYTVSQSIAEEFERVYKLPFEVIRNVPFSRPYRPQEKREKIIVYQGALNKDRGLEQLLAAAEDMPWTIYLYGDGDIKENLIHFVKEKRLEKNVFFKGKLAPNELWIETQKAYIGINLAVDKSLSYKLSLSNKLFDYIQAGIPQLMIDLPEFQRINNQAAIGLLINSLEVTAIQTAINRLLDDEKLYISFVQNCISLRAIHHWENESEKLIKLYNDLFK
jgi:glycosyltransferase involved in cell wall biosynthesis